MPIRINIPTSLQFKRIYNQFIEYGFSDAESMWAADNNLDPRGPKRYQIGRLLRNRLYLVKTLLEHETAWTWDKAVDYIDKGRRRQAIEQGYEDDMNLFVGETP